MNRPENSYIGRKKSKVKKSMVQKKSNDSDQSDKRTHFPAIKYIPKKKKRNRYSLCTIDTSLNFTKEGNTSICTMFCRKILFLMRPGNGNAFRENPTFSQQNRKL